VTITFRNEARNGLEQSQKKLGVVRGRLGGTAGRIRREGKSVKWKMDWGEDGKSGQPIVKHAGGDENRQSGLFTSMATRTATEKDPDGPIKNEGKEIPKIGRSPG